MIRTKAFGAIALSHLIGIAACGNSSNSNNNAQAGTDTTGGGTGMCGTEATHCCAAPAQACGGGLTCSDEFCLTCGPAPASFMGCTNVATTGSATAASAEEGGAPDDPHLVI